MIAANVAYTLRAFREALGLTKRTWGALVKAGLPHTRIGRSVTVLGEDYLEFVRRKRKQGGK